jgi:hypothetical protein
MAQRASDSAGFATVSEKCPCHPALACAVHSVMYKPVTAEAFRIALRAYEARIACRITFYRSEIIRAKQKRGPPTPLV